MTAGLALFIALGGSAAAAVTLDRDSVGSPQIRADAVRSPEIVSGAVRSSEIRDGGVKAVDVAAGAQAALRGEVRVAENVNGGFDPVPRCGSDALSDCPDQLALQLSSGAGARVAPEDPQLPAPPATEPGRNWLVQAKLEVAVNNGPGFQGATCGLVDRSATGPGAVLDEAAMLVQPEQSAIENIALSAVVRKRAGNPTLALRCSSPDGNEVIASQLKITALEVGAVTGP